jgi:pyruvate dehydrogenase E1 component alpha subunit
MTKSSGSKVHLTREHAQHLLRQMILIRRFEERCAELYSAQKIRGFLHLYIGQEANAVGIMQALMPDDAVVATYREHGHALARGLPVGEVMAEMFGKAAGSSRGRGGSMHVFDIARRFYGGNAIVGGALPVAVGLALADKMQKRKRVTCCIFGEGAAAEGEFHESLNLAALWKLPVLFVCENNGYAMGTSVERSESIVEMAAHARCYGVPAEVVDGMDVVAVEAAARQAADAIRAGSGPQFLENKTYRFRAHSMFDAELYRDKAEVAAWKSKDPIPRFADWLQAMGVIHAEAVDEIEQSVGAEISAAIEYAEAAGWEPVEDLLKDVYTTAGEEPLV